MASVNPLLALWRAGKPSLGGWLTTADPQIAEYLASVGFDEICVDQQHGIADGTLLASLFRSIELHGVAPTTRVPANDFTAIGKALDVGAVAVIIPMVGSAEEAAAAAHACHYPPRGGRSVG
ncbi:MAG: 2,4-dihydroxyhept-2-ene-1,7-dioic acid aldolase, partial [Chloroflexi bacterium]|nr:2,4-dihydroxyhept-2-ene-1,7-dioic acid aldolase [Chloroflexota bacterium]